MFVDYTYVLIVPFGRAYTGLASSVIAQVFDSTGAQHGSDITAGWAEETDYAGSANTGVYLNTTSIDPSWPTPIRIKYTIAGVVGLVSEEVIGGPVDVKDVASIPSQPTTAIRNESVIQRNEVVEQS